MNVRAFTAAALLAFAAPAAAQAAPAPPVALAAASANGRGGIDADVRAQGTTVGHLQGHLDATGYGVLTYRRAGGKRGTVSESLVARGRAAAGGHAVVAVGDHGSRLKLDIDRVGALTGAGHVGKRRVRVAGVGREIVPALRKGMKMLVLGKPSGEGYTALKRQFEPVRFDGSTHTRKRFLADRAHFGRYAALVVGKGVEGLDEHKLLRAFYGAGRWVVVAPGTKRAVKELAEVHAVGGAKGGAAVAVRSLGPEGASYMVRPTITFPAAAKALHGKPSPAMQRASEQRRGRWFRSQLDRFAGPYMDDARTGSTAAAASGPRARAASVNFSLPPGAAAIQVAIPYYHEFTISGPSGNEVNSDWCAWNQKTLNAWCADTWYYQQVLKDMNYDIGATCRTLMNGNDDYKMISKQVIDRAGIKHNGTDPYVLPKGAISWAYILKASNGDACPDHSDQTGSYSGNNYYFALYSKDKQQHTIVELTDPTVNATLATGTDGAPKLAQRGWNTHGRLESYVPTPSWTGLFLPEDAWFLGGYSHKVTLSGTNLGDLNFIYSQNQSFPTQQITFTGQSTSQSQTTSFNVGFFGADPQGGAGVSNSLSTSLSVNVPNWAVSPVTSRHEAQYVWTTNAPTNYANHIAAGSGGPFSANGDALNPLNLANFGPTSLTAWTGAPTWGPVKVAVQDLVLLADHWSAYDGVKGYTDGYDTRMMMYADEPNGATPTTATPASAGINLCDPAVRDPDFKDKCGN